MAQSLLDTILTCHRHAPAVSVGTSTKGRPIHAFQLGCVPTSHTVLSPSNQTLVIGAFHGDEPESAQLLTKWLLQQLEEPTSDLPPTLCVPVFNPDGLIANTRHNGRGIDLNRNYPTKNFDATTDPLDHYHGGTTPASEAETLWLMDLIQQAQPSRILSLHTPYRVVNYDGPAKDWAEHVSSHLPEYPVTTDIGYPTPGSFGTYYGVERNIPIITLELMEEPIGTLWPTHGPAITAACCYPL